jgi:outer membrane protein OmpA-like peptidoglycan-associated protein/tetratricopeptide (TPR) repeat protein
MKKILLLLTLVCCYLGFAQDLAPKTKAIFNSDLKKANTYYRRASYAKAIPLYESVLRKHRTKDLVERLATCYYNTGDLRASARLYGYLLSRDDASETYENSFKYAHALRASGNYEDANSVMREYYTAVEDTAARSAFNAAVKTLENVAAIGQRYTLENLPLNTAQSEFGLVAYKNHVVFAASNKSQKRSSLLKGFYGWNNEPFLDLYTMHKDSLFAPNAIPKSISNVINTKLHEAAVAFSKDHKTMYFTRNNYYKRKEIKDDNAVTHLKLYKAELVDSVWTNVIALPFNGDAYSVEHPALSPDGKRLYFASDMPGSLGSFDLFYVDIETDSTYSAPVNLGPSINTQHREQFPFIASNGDLYFASNGHLGFGGLDVFWAPLKNDSFKKPDNLGLPLNSGYDDFAFVVDETLQNGFVASNRKDGKGSDDIYSFKEEKPLIIEDCKQYITGVITDKTTTAPIPYATLTITKVFNNYKEDLGYYLTEEDGRFNVDSDCNLSVVVKVEAEGYKSEERQIAIGQERYKKNDASMALLSLAAIKKQEEEARLRLIAQEKELELKKFAEAKEKETQHQRQKEKEKLDKEKEIARIIASEPLIKRVRGRLVIETDDINFDYKLWYIRRDVKRILQPVLALMRKYPKMEINIESHTDIRGNKTYNKNLSQKRASSTKDYLASEGLGGERIKAIGYGESNPIIPCASEETCSEEDHEGNRRSEFVITKIL